MILYLVRHAEAQPAGGAVMSDAERALTERGLEDARLIGRMIAMAESHVASILTSPLVRARQTGSCIAEAYATPPAVHVTENLSPGFRQKALLAHLATFRGSDSVVAIGHQPDMSQLISMLIADAAAEITMPTGAVARLTVQPAAHHAAAMLTWLVTPELLRAITLPAARRLQ